MTDFLGTAFSPLGAAGTLSLLLALGFTLVALVSGVLGGLRRDERLTGMARSALWGNFAFMTAALGLLEYAILTDDFSVRYVANHSMSVSPLWVKVVTLWAALEGSVLLWAWMLSLYAFLASLTARRDVLRPWVLATMAVSVAFFVGLNLTVASPFTPVVDVPTDGRGPNPLLQNHWMMAVHPVLMYLGFVGLSVPFAYAVAALITGRLGESWLVQTRRWTLVAWGFLSAAIAAGAWWSYEILGWGGYWAWDPVENASFIPWLLATAFLHSVQIQERRRMLKSWNIHLIVFAYAATVLGTFLTRSGVVESVHAFSNGPIGPVFLGFFVLLVALGVGLATWRLPQIRDPHSLDSPVSREGAVLGGNVVFVVFALFVVLGTLFPVLVEALRGIRTSVGEPFYNYFAIPLGLLLLLLMGIGPVMPWRKLGGSLWALARWPVLAFVAGTALAFAFGIRNLGLALTLGLCAYNVVGLASLIGGSVRARGGLRSLPGLVREYPRRYGAYLAHLGIVLMAVGIGFSSTYKARQEVTLRLNQPQSVLGKTVTLTRVGSEQRPERQSIVATVRVGEETLTPKLNRYVNMPQEVAMPAVKYHLMGDTYVTLLAGGVQEGWATVAVIDSPLVSWIWWGSAVLLLGTALSVTAPIRETVAVPAPQRLPSGGVTA
ncbi:cytochrome c-type biogenesis protein CcmF [Deinococcus reticulitermitis]|uniref:Cytochrome c-type biogenesis protein CcmF n=1 Tax=Deinococcus reticulitermitis TaxID=856736 RepID=A0A1H7B815_9DEIO|nr:heme lyase CcmF/NrfE family subunit [Deinococcus reticulitermitis]SEJ73286.1 cytochrome c-type biogenesis protein CcmF [Deinococcus reticulitermitis]